MCPHRVQKNAIAIAAFQITNSKIATLTAGSAETLQKNRRMKSQIAAFRNRKFQIAMFFCLWNSKDKSKVPKLSEIKYRCDFLGTRFRIAAFPRFRNRSVFGTLRMCPHGVWNSVCVLPPASHTWEPHTRGMLLHVGHYRSRPQTSECTLRVSLPCRRDFTKLSRAIPDPCVSLVLLSRVWTWLNPTSKFPWCPGIYVLRKWQPSSRTRLSKDSKSLQSTSVGFLVPSSAHPQTNELWTL